MYRLLNRTTRFDATAFKYPRMEWLAGRLEDNFKKLVSSREFLPVRVDSNHLLFKIIKVIDIPFTGDLFKYMSDVDAFTRTILGGLGIVSSFSRGRLFTEGVFYPGCPEIIVYSRDDNADPMALWKHWRTVSPIQVICHPVTDLEVVELGIKNEFEMADTDLAIIKIDIPLLMAQYVMWKSTYPERNTEFFISTIPLVNAVRSHLDIAFFNRVQAELGIKPLCDIRTNVPFAQTNVNTQVRELVTDILQKVKQKKMTGNQILSSIPVPFGRSVLDAVNIEPTTPTFQVVWALLAAKMEPIATILEIGKVAGYDMMLRELTVIRRSVIEIKNDNLFDSVMTTAGSVLMKDRLLDLVVTRIPE